MSCAYQKQTYYFLFLERKLKKKMDECLLLWTGIDAWLMGVSHGNPGWPDEYDIWQYKYLLTLPFIKFYDHCYFTYILVMQNIFAQGKCTWNITLIIHILVLFTNGRDESHVQTLLGQVYPTSRRALIKAYKYVMAALHGYLVVDCIPKTLRELKLKTMVFQRRRWCTT